MSWLTFALAWILAAEPGASPRAFQSAAQLERLCDGPEGEREAPRVFCLGYLAA